MATQISGPYQDPEFNLKTKGFCVGGKSNASKVQKKGGLGGRKPLGEISNIKASQNQAVNKNPVNTKGLSQIKEEKVVKTGGRKPLGDISNFRKPSSLVAPTKNSSSIPHLDVRDEGFLHDHKKCIKAQSVNNIYEDMDYFLETIGLAKESSVGLKCSPGHPLPKKVEPGSPSMMLSELGMESEVSEMLLDDSPSRSKKMWLEMESSPPPCQRPKSLILSHNDNWIDHDFPELVLMGSPVAQKP